MNRSNLALAATIVATLAIGTGLMFALDDGARIITENPRARALILSDVFWPAVFGFICVMLILLVGVLSSYEFHPDRLSGRNVPERGE